MDWYFEAKADFDTKPGIMDPMYVENVTDEQVQTMIEYFSTFLTKLNDRWTDDRIYVAGRDVTAADFNLLAFYTSIVVNPGINKPEIGTALKAKIDELPNTKRVIENIVAPLQKIISKLPATQY